MTAYLEAVRLLNQVDGRKLSPLQAETLALYGLHARSVVISTVAATTQPVSVPVPGTARLMVGFACINSGAVLDDTQITLNVNNDTIVNQVNVQAFAPGTFAANPWVPFVRPLSGQDTVDVVITDTTATQTVEFVFYFLQLVTFN